MEEYVDNKVRKLKVIGKFDVVVAGGGTAGVVAAIAAARRNKSVLIVEQLGILGGSETAALVTPMMDTCIKENPMCSSISDEINAKMIETGFGAHRKDRDNDGYFDPVYLSFILENMVLKSRVNILYYTFISDVIVDNDEIKGLIVENKDGRCAVFGKRIIDCTGDGDVCAKAGVPYESGNPDGGKNQAMSVRYMMDNIDMDKFIVFLDGVYGGRNFYYAPPVFQICCVWGENQGIEKIFKKAYDNGDITYEDGKYWQVFGVPGRQSTLAFNCPEIFENIDGTSSRDLTRAQIKAREAIVRQHKFYKKYFKGFENAWVCETAQQVGVRESRRIRGIYYLSDEDVLNQRKFIDFIAKSNYPVDVHGMKYIYKNKSKDECKSGCFYEIPFRCLIPEKIKHLLVAGRCISVSFLAQSSTRIQPTVRATGEAAGIAASISIDRNIDINEVTGQEVRIEMIKNGAEF